MVCLSLVLNPMAHDFFFSIKPSDSTFPFHCSLQASKQASKNLHDRLTNSRQENDNSRKCRVCDLFGTTDKSNRIGMLSPTVSCAMCQPMEKYPSHHLLSSLSISNSSHRAWSHVSRIEEGRRTFCEPSKKRMERQSPLVWYSSRWKWIKIRILGRIERPVWSWQKNHVLSQSH